ncbi:DUF2059 domain-containing protein [uncultured Roseobacter sp.]|uniref:DUF2059 domain-containing protein n=1 Tax=uncultured Roseobacter sp. TaxID=114847 RepID=UPI002601B2C7|nr:DUF2059 domain-containing protein [uncultured Roseobacter sp.]
MRFLPILAVLALSTGAFAQDTERLEAAKAYVDSKGQQGLMDDMLSPEGVMASMGLLGDQLTPEQQTTVARIVSEELATIRPTMESAMISGMAENFTLDEINALADFYASEHGASAMRKMTPFMTQTMQSIGPAFQQMQANLARRIQEEFSK